MKKFVALLCVLVVFAAFAVPAFAATREDLVEELKAGFMIDGVEKKVPERYVQLVRNYLDAHSVTEAELLEGIQSIKDIKAEWAQAGEWNFENLPAAKKQEFIQKATAVAAKYDVVLTTSGRNVQLTDKSGKVFYVSGQVVGQTGADYTALFVIVSLIVIAVGASMVMIRKFRLTEVTCK